MQKLEDRGWVTKEEETGELDIQIAIPHFQWYLNMTNSNRGRYQSTFLCKSNIHLWKQPMKHWYIHKYLKTTHDTLIHSQIS